LNREMPNVARGGITFPSPNSRGHKHNRGRLQKATTRGKIEVALWIGKPEALSRRTPHYRRSGLLRERGGRTSRDFGGTMFLKGRGRGIFADKGVQGVPPQ